MKILILIITLSAFAIQGRADDMQNNNSKDTLQLRPGASKYIGTWKASISPNDTVYITFVKKIMYFKKMGEYFEGIIGSVKRTKNGNVIFSKEIDNNNNIVGETETPLFGAMTFNDGLLLNYNEGKECNNNGTASFKLEDDNTAIWSLKSTREAPKLDKFRIPAKLIFKRELFK